MNNIIAKELKAWRIKRDYDLRKVAYDMGVCYETMRRYENGQTNITIEFLEKMLDYYNVDISIFFENICANMHETDIQVESG